MSEHKLHILKLEIETAIDRNFWGKGPPDRPKTDPGKGGFVRFVFGNPRVATAGVTEGPR